MFFVVYRFLLSSLCLGRDKFFQLFKHRLLDPSIVRTQPPFLLRAKLKSVLTEFVRQSVKEATDTIEGGQRAFVDKGVRDRCILEDEDIEVHAGGLLDELVEGFCRVFLFVMLPEQTFQL